MAFQTRAASIDMTSIELQESPAPTYRSTFQSEDWPLSPQSKNQYHQDVSAASSTPPNWSGKVPITDEESIPTKPDYHDPNHPHYVEPSPRPFKPYPLPLPHRRRRWPQKRVLIPWSLVLLFFLTTLWFTSIALGSRFLSILHPLPSNPAVQEIHVFINDQDLRSVSVSASIVTLTSALSSTQTPTRTESRNGNPMRTGVLAPEFEPPAIEKNGDNAGPVSSRQERLARPSATSFATATITKMRRA